jgi:hypothetical protein
MTTINTIGNFEAAGTAPGNVPLGGIIAMTTGLTGAMAIPASGVVSNGYMRADGVAIPGGNKVSGTPPNLSTSVFLRGAATFGGAGGGTASLVAANIPQVSTSYTPAGTVDISHTHGASSVTGTVDATNLTHTHTYSGTTTTTGSSHAHDFLLPGAGGNPGIGGANNSDSVPANVANAYAGVGTGQSTHTHTYSGTTDNNNGTLNHGHTFSSGSAAGQTLGTTNKSLSGTPATITVGSASPTSFNVIPNYIDVVYLIRVS